jgi:pyrroline-5-carboxylate reductase
MSAVRLILAGGGKMGGALLEGWIKGGAEPASLAVVEPDAGAAAHSKRLGVVVVSTLDQIAADAKPDAVVFAVKPQVMGQVVPAYKRFAAASPVFLSIAAGITTGFFEGELGAGAAVVRAMPNLPASVHRGISGAFANAKVSAAQRQRAQGLLEAVGEVVWVDSESLIDAVTAVSGSGPAYVFLLAECLAKAGAAAGLPPEMALRLARSTVTGAGELLARSSESAETLRKNVTSPGGTTAAALEVLMGNDGLQPLMDKAVAAAARRSRELAQ